MLQTQQIAEFILHSTLSDLEKPTVDQLKKHLLDSIGSFIYSTNKSTILKLSAQIQTFSDGGPCKAPGIGNIAIDRAAQFYTALIRYPDFMDNFLGKEATCHPSDNIGAVLAASQMLNSRGSDFLLAMAIGYQIECRLVQEIPVMQKGFDHTALLGYSATAAVAKIFNLGKDQTANALAIAGCSFNPMVTSRASYTCEWKGLASSLVALNAINIALLARQNITGPIQLFEGPKGFNEIMGMELNYNWEKENFGLIRKCILKSYNAEVHTQSAIEAALELKQQYNFAPDDIDEIEVIIFKTGYDIVGGGLYGGRSEVNSKEQADHSLPYVIAVAILDGQVMPRQLKPHRIHGKDVQALLRKVKARTLFPFSKPVKLMEFIDPYTTVYPDKVPARVVIKFKNGTKIAAKKEDYKGFFTRPLSWKDVEHKFKSLSDGIIVKKSQQDIIEVIRSLETRRMSELFNLLNAVGMHPEKRKTDAPSPLPTLSHAGKGL